MTAIDRNGGGPSSPTGRTGRLAGLDWLRVLCTVAVVAIHVLSTAPCLHRLWRCLSFAVPCFVLMSLVLALPRLRGASLRTRLQFFSARALRLGQPYLAWTLVFLILRLLWGSLTWRPGVVVGSILFGGAAMHLYFVPLLVLFTAFCCLLPGRRPAWLAVGGLGVALSRWLQGFTWPMLALGTAEAASFPHYLRFELPFLFSALLIGAVWTPVSSPVAAKRNVPAVFAALIPPLGLAGIAWSSLSLDGSSHTIVFWMAVCTLFVGALYCPWPCPAPLRALGEVSFGIFFCHPLFLAILTRAEHSLGLDSGRVDLTLLRLALVLTASALLALALGRFQATRFLVR